MNRIDRITYAGWKDCLRLANDRVELVVTTEVGPRILRFGAIGGANLFHEVPAQRGQTGGDAWRSLGGHRLWHAPEAKPRTYAPDNGPVSFEILEGGVRLVQPVEPSTGIQKELEISFESDGFRVLHRLCNRGPWPLELAPWAITIMAPDGVAILPQEPFAPHPDFPEGTGEELARASYLPARTLALWSYTRLNDPRWVFLDRFILVKQDRGLAAPLKFGLSNRQGWCGYALKGELFLKRFPWQEGARYPDAGCNNEVFTHADMLEVESLGPLVTLGPQASVEHTETWFHAGGFPLALEDASLTTALANPLR